MSANACLGAIFIGFTLGEYNLSKDFIKEIFEVSKEEEYLFDALVNSLLPVGAVFGTAFTKVFKYSFYCIR